MPRSGSLWTRNRDSTLGKWCSILGSNLRLALKCHPQRVENRQAELQPFLMAQDFCSTWAVCSRWLMLASPCQRGPYSLFISSSLSSPCSINCSSKLINLINVESELTERLLSVSLKIVFGQLLLCSLLILATKSLNLWLIFQGMSFQFLHSLCNLLSYHANLVFKCEKS